MRRILSAALCLALLGAACGSDQPVRDTGGESGTTSSPALDAVKVTGDPGEKPTLTFDEPLDASETARRVVTEGDGDPIATGSVVSFHYLFVNGRDGSEIGTSYDTDPAELVFEDNLMVGVFKGLDGVKSGSRVLVAIAPGDGGGADENTGLKDTDTVLFFAEVLDVRQPLAHAEGTAVAPVDGLPTVELADDGAPTITMPGGEPPTELVVQPLIEGTGATVASGESITVHYTGALWKDGTVFDSTWETDTPATFQIGTGSVIAGWDEGLVGQKVGSQVLLVVPPAKGYPTGSPDGTISATDTIVFVIDILDASG